MSEKISEYTTSVTALASGDLMDVSKLISTSPDVYQSQKLNYSVLLTELNNDLSITLQSIYNASTQPQITTSIAKGGVVIRSGQALDTNSVLELKNIAGSSTFVVGGNGIVATGNWQATAIAAAFGGTGQTSYSIGDLIYASNTAAIAKLGIGTAGQVLTVSGGGIPSWAAVSASNLGNANLTANAAERSYTLFGNSSSDKLIFKNLAGTDIFRIYGNCDIDYRGGGVKRYYDSAGNNTIALYASSAKGTINISGNDSEVQLTNNVGSYALTRARSAGAQSTWIDNSGNTKIDIFAYLGGLLAVGKSATGAANLEIRGSGSTSATTTALFENSSSVAALKVKDDLYCIFRAKNAVIPDADLANNEMSFYIEEATNDLHFKVKYSTGTVKSGKVNLT